MARKNTAYALEALAQRILLSADPVGAVLHEDNSDLESLPHVLETAETLESIWENAENSTGADLDSVFDSAQQLEETVAKGTAKPKYENNRQSTADIV